jgi:mannosyltransferase OCH1-like enzyme
MGTPASGVAAVRLSYIAVGVLGAIVGAVSMAAWDTATGRDAWTKVGPGVTSPTLRVLFEPRVKAFVREVADDGDKGHNPQLRNQRTESARTQPGPRPPRAAQGWGYPEAIPKHIHQTWRDAALPCPSTWAEVNPGFG